MNNFIIDNCITKLPELISSCAPFQKVIFLYDFSTAFSFVEEIETSIKDKCVLHKQLLSKDTDLQSLFHTLADDSYRCIIIAGDSYTQSVQCDSAESIIRLPTDYDYTAMLTYTDTIIIDNALIEGNNFADIHYLALSRSEILASLIATIFQCILIGDTAKVQLLHSVIDNVIASAGDLSSHIDMIGNMMTTLYNKNIILDTTIHHNIHSLSAMNRQISTSLIINMYKQTLLRSVDNSSMIFDLYKYSKKTTKYTDSYFDIIDYYYQLYNTPMGDISSHIHIIVHIIDNAMRYIDETMNRMIYRYPAEPYNIKNILSYYNDCIDYNEKHNKKCILSYARLYCII